MCERGDKRSVLQGHRVKAFALAAYVNPNNCSNYLIHREALAHRLPHQIHPYRTAFVPLQQQPQTSSIIRNHIQPHDYKQPSARWRIATSYCISLMA